MDNDICPCNGCVPPERYPGCHGKCPKYKAWNERHLLRKATYDATKLCDRICDDYDITISTKNAKARRCVDKYRRGGKC